MKKAEIRKRREFFWYALESTLSLKTALQGTSSKFGVSIAVLRVDWSRRRNWPPEIFGKIDDMILEELYNSGITKSLHQTELIISQNENLNCKLGALKLKISTYFKLKSGVEDKNYKKLLIERLEKLEKLAEKGVFIP